jgi:hypothetical protein
MAALTSARSTWQRAINFITLPLPAGYTAQPGGRACLDTANPGNVYPAYAGQSTLIPIGVFVNNLAVVGSATASVNVQLEPNEVWVRNWDSVTGSGAVTIANQLQEIYMASDHEVTTTAGSNAKGGRVWDVTGDGVWVQDPFPGQSAS